PARPPAPSIPPPPRAGPTPTSEKPAIHDGRPGRPPVTPFSPTPLAGPTPTREKSPVASLDAPVRPAAAGIFLIDSAGRPDPDQGKVAGARTGFAADAAQWEALRQQPAD